MARPLHQPHDPILHLTRETLAEGTRYLRRTDRRFAPWIDRVGPVGLRRQRHRFSALCRSIIAQQLGSGAAKSIWLRFMALFEPDPHPTPARLLELDEAPLRACGLSGPKIDYLRALATEFDRGALRRARLASMPDREVIELLTEVRGIGVWTAEMFLIFSLGRRDVFSCRDLALRAAVQRIEGRELTAGEVERVAARWSPYRSVASLYLWKVAHWRESAS